MRTNIDEKYQAARAAVGPDLLLLFKVGDFYEAYHDDADRLAKALELVVTQSSKGADAVRMAGFPHHQLEPYLRKMLAAGIKTALVDSPNRAHLIGVDPPGLPKWRVTGTKRGKPQTVVVEAVDHNAAVRAGSMSPHMLVVTEAVLVDP